MPNTFIAAALGGLAGSILTAGANYLVANKQIRAQDDRRVGEFYLEKKVDALEEYHIRLRDFSAELSIYKSKAYNAELSEEEYRDELVPLHNEYSKSLDRVTPYLSEDQREVLEATSEPFREATRHIKEAIEEIDSGGESVVKSKEGFEHAWDGEEIAKRGREAEDLVRTELRDGVDRLERAD